MSILDDLRRAWNKPRWDFRLVGKSAIDTGPTGHRAMRIARQLNTVRSGRAKEAVVLWKADYSAVTRIGKWVYVSKTFAERLSDDALAFVLAHEMAHHDLGHLTIPVAVAGRVGWSFEMELAADRRAARIARDAGFDPRGGLEAMADDLWEDEPEPEVIDDSSPLGKLQTLLQKWRETHPPLDQRRESLQTALSALAS